MVFADRTYQSDGSLTPRTQPDAVIHDPAIAIDRVRRMIEEGKVKSTGGPDVVRNSRHAVHSWRRALAP